MLIVHRSGKHGKQSLQHFFLAYTVCLGLHAPCRQLTMLHDYTNV